MCVYGTGLAESSKDNTREMAINHLISNDLTDHITGAKSAPDTLESPAPNSTIRLTIARTAPILPP
jgi:hypothetical protein